jgi:hypothetical protein
MDNYDGFFVNGWGDGSGNGWGIGNGFGDGLSDDKLWSDNSDWMGDGYGDTDFGCQLHGGIGNFHLAGDQQGTGDGNSDEYLIIYRWEN